MDRVRIALLRLLAALKLGRAGQERKAYSEALKAAGWTPPYRHPKVRP